MEPRSASSTNPSRASLASTCGTCTSQRSSSAETCRYGPTSFKDIIAKLLTMGDSEAGLIAQTAATGNIPQDGDDRQRTVYAIAELITHDPREWNAVWPVLQANERLGTEVLQLIAYEREHNSFATAIREDQIAEICIWLSERGLDRVEKDRNCGLVTPPIALANWRNTLINLLMYKGTPSACDAIKRLRDRKSTRLNSSHL